MTTHAELPQRGYQVPKISELLARLKFDPQRNKVNEDGKNLLDSLISEFRANFETSDGLRGAELDFWSIPEQREGLKEMAVQFLAQSGSRLWPSDESEEYYEPNLIWTRDEEEITRLLMQVFFRKNIHHKQFLKRKSASSAEVPEGRSPRRSKTHRRSNAAPGAAARRAASLRRARVPRDIETVENEIVDDVSMSVEALDQQNPSSQTTAELEHTAPDDENDASLLLPSSRAANSPSRNITSGDISAPATSAPSADVNIMAAHEGDRASLSGSHIGQANLTRHSNSRRVTHNANTPQPVPASLVSEGPFPRVRYYIVRSRRPKRSEMWFPAGTFSGKTLALLKAESNLEVGEDAGDIRFVLSEIQTGDSVACRVGFRSEYCFREMKNEFTEFIREHLSERRGLVSFRMEIEQLASRLGLVEEAGDSLHEGWIFDSNSTNGI